MRFHESWSFGAHSSPGTWGTRDEGIENIRWDQRERDERALVSWGAWNPVELPGVQYRMVSSLRSVLKLFNRI